MIKARLQRGNDTILVLGLTRQNVTRLLDDQPIHVRAEQLRAMGLPTDMEVLLIGGETEASMSEQLGGLPLQPEVPGQEFVQRPTALPTTSLNAAREGQLTASLLAEELEDADPNALVVIHQGRLLYGVSAVELRGPTVRLHTAVANCVPVERLRAMVKLLSPEEMTPTAKRQLELLAEEYE